ncbi:MAG: hypothetical protein KDC44_00580, partial [Phaeodactylibacter sp.]|nr:hypothetical protein [Phaeodactylibacter sp.]
MSDAGFQIANPNGGQEFAYYYVDDVAVLASAGDLTAAIAPPSPLSCVEPVTVLDASGSSAGPGITYSWDGPNGFTSTL